MQTYERDSNHNGVAGCYPAFHSEFCGGMIAKRGQRAADCKNRYGCFVLFDESLDSLWKVPMIALCILQERPLLIYFGRDTGSRFAERQKHFVEEQQVKAMKKRLEEAENFYGSIRKVRHEMKNHGANIKRTGRSRGVWGNRGLCTADG